MRRFLIILSLFIANSVFAQSTFKLPDQHGFPVVSVGRVKALSSTSTPNNDVTNVIQTISTATTLVLPTSGHSLQNITLAATVTISIPPGFWIGQNMVTNTCENGTGGFTPTFAGTGGATLKGVYPAPTTTALKCDLCNWIYTATNIWQFANCAQNE